MMEEILRVLCCPETHQSLRMADANMVAELNEKIKSGQVRNRAGKPVTETMERGLIREDGKYVYPITKNIPVLLVNEAIPV